MWPLWVAVLKALLGRKLAFSRYCIGNLLFRITLDLERERELRSGNVLCVHPKPRPLGAFIFVFVNQGYDVDWCDSCRLFVLFNSLGFQHFLSHSLRMLWRLWQGGLRN